MRIGAPPESALAVGPGASEEDVVAAAHRSAVAAEMDDFHASVSKLMENHALRWVVFFEGKVHAEFDNQKDAYVGALTMFGPSVPVVVARVEETTSVYQTAAYAFHAKS